MSVCLKQDTGLPVPGQQDVPSMGLLLGTPYKRRDNHQAGERGWLGVWRSPLPRSPEPFTAQVPFRQGLKLPLPFIRRYCWLFSPHSLMKGKCPVCCIPHSGWGAQGQMNLDLLLAVPAGAAAVMERHNSPGSQLLRRQRASLPRAACKP